MLGRGELEEIRERAKKATKGSWKWQECYDCSLLNSEGNEIITVVGDDMSYIKVLRDEDAKFIAHAREDIPKLLETIDKLEAYRNRYEVYCDGYKQGQYDIQMDNLNGE
ncbi:hypothetical protein ABE354_23355 [Brevibacillus laterosporus]|uniref:hypothetical protein n=1 Tax=Brevibacillus laterosporus TaxID=1465 RepID=UPI003D2407D0